MYHIRHAWKPSLCLNNYGFDGNYLKCQDCNRNIAGMFDGSVFIFDPYTKYRNEIETIYKSRSPNKATGDGWEKVHKEIELITKEAEQIREANERYAETLADIDEDYIDEESDANEKPAEAGEVTVQVSEEFPPEIVSVPSFSQELT